MLYLDTFALVKLYFKEAGSDAVIARASGPSQELFTSMLTYAEVHSVMARKRRERATTAAKLAELRAAFEKDWTDLLHTVELNQDSLAAIPGLLDQFALKSGDAVQLSTAVWLIGKISVEGQFGGSSTLEFCVADRKLAQVANACGLQVFNPEDLV